MSKKTRQKKKNMLKRMNKQEAATRKMSRALAVVLDENVLLQRECKDLEKEIDYFGTLPIFEPICAKKINSPLKEISTETIHVIPIPYGMAEQLRPEEMLYKTIEDKKREIAIGLAESLINNHAVQFIHTPANITGGPLGRETLAAKLYVVPWYQAQAYTDNVFEIRMTGHETDKNYAVEIVSALHTMTPEEREAWICGMWEEIQHWR